MPRPKIASTLRRRERNSTRRVADRLSPWSAGARDRIHAIAIVWVAGPGRSPSCECDHADLGDRTSARRRTRSRRASKSDDRLGESNHTRRLARRPIGTAAMSPLRSSAAGRVATIALAGCAVAPPARFDRTGGWCWPRSSKHPLLLPRKSRVLGPIAHCAWRTTPPVAQVARRRCCPRGSARPALLAIDASSRQGDPANRADDDRGVGRLDAAWERREDDEVRERELVAVGTEWPLSRFQIWSTNPRPRGSSYGSVSIHPARQPVSDRGGLARIGHGLDLVEALLVADADALVLAEMLVPGADDELLEDVPGVGRVAPHAPAHRACAAPGVAPGVAAPRRGRAHVPASAGTRPSRAPARRSPPHRLVAGRASHRRATDRQARST